MSFIKLVSGTVRNNFNRITPVYKYYIDVCVGKCMYGNYIYNLPRSMYLATLYSILFFCLLKFFFYYFPSSFIRTKHVCKRSFLFYSHFLNKSEICVLLNNFCFLINQIIKIWISIKKYLILSNEFIDHMLIF